MIAIGLPNVWQDVLFLGLRESFQRLRWSAGARKKTRESFCQIGAYNLGWPFQSILDDQDIGYTEKPRTWRHLTVMKTWIYTTRWKTVVFRTSANNRSTASLVTDWLYVPPRGRNCKESEFSLSARSTFSSLARRRHFSVALCTHDIVLWQRRRTKLLGMALPADHRRWVNYHWTTSPIHYRKKTTSPIHYWQEEEEEEEEASGNHNFAWSTQC